MASRCDAAVAERSSGWNLTRTRAVWAWPVAAVAVLPLVVLPIRALADIWRAPALLPQRLGTRGFEVLTSTGTRVGEAVTTSLLVALLATAVALVLGWPAARLLATAAPRQRVAVLAVLALPLLVPPYAVGTGLAAWLLRLGLADTVAGLVAAHLVYVLPYVVLVLTPAFGDEVRRQEEAARTLGADLPARLRLVALPATAPSTALAGLLGFIVSWSQYGTSLAVGGGRLTLPVVLLPFVERDPQVAAMLALVFLLPPLCALALSHRLWR